MMQYIALPGDTFSSILAKRYSEIAAPDLDRAAAWLGMTNPQLLAGGGVVPGESYTVLPWQDGGISYSP